MPHRRLIVTNGKAAAANIRRTSVSADSILTWDDVLHDGPVRGELSRHHLNEERASYLAGAEHGSYLEIFAGLERRDAALARNLQEADEVVLWFEHDLYDQLQLIQILDRVDLLRAGAAVSVVCEDRFVGEATAEELEAAFSRRVPADSAAVRAAKDAWQAFISPSPHGMEEIVGRTETALPFLPSAFDRLLQELPHPHSGLSRTELQILESLNDGPAAFGTVFSSSQRREDARFMGDTTVWIIFRRLFDGPSPLVKQRGGSPHEAHGGGRPPAPNDVFEIRDAGRAVLAGAANAIDHVGLDRWLGGTHLARSHYWAYDDQALSGPHSRP